MRDIRREARALVLLALVIVFGLAVGIYLVVHQRIVWPTWVPFAGKQEFVLKAQVSAVAGVLPGQGQAVTIAGVDVGEIDGVTLTNGVPIVQMEINEQYASRIYSNATVLLRPKTGLNDMVAELDPGSSNGGTRLHSGATLGSSQTLPTVSLDEVLSQLDSDTRDELMMLVSNAGEALANGGGTNLGNVFRRFDPLSRDVREGKPPGRAPQRRAQAADGQPLEAGHRARRSRLAADRVRQGQRGRVPRDLGSGPGAQADDPAAARRARSDQHGADPGDDARQDAHLDARPARLQRPRSRPHARGPAPVLQRDDPGDPRPAASVLGQGAADRQGARARRPPARAGDAAPRDARDRAQQHRQRARLQAEERPELPVLPALGQPRHELGPVHPGRGRPDPARPDPVLLRLAGNPPGSRQSTRTTRRWPR